MRAAVATVMTFIALTANAQESIKTRAGELKIEGSMYEPKLTLNGKVLNSGESLAYSFPAQTKYQFAIKDSDVILVGDAVSATCQMYFFVTIPKPPAAPTKTDSFGTCDDNPKVTQNGSSISLIMKTQKGGKQTFKYENGKVGWII